MERVPCGVLSHILSYVNDYSHMMGMPYYAPRLLRLRLVNRAFNAAIINFRPLWLELLDGKGPRRIGAASVHRRGVANCRLGFGGRCNIAAHYQRQSLELVYDATKPYQAHQVAIKFFRARQVKHVTRDIKLSQRQLTQDAERLEKIIEATQERKQRFERAIAAKEAELGRLKRKR